jgi:hypothetical protein
LCFGVLLDEAIDNSGRLILGVERGHADAADFTALVALQGNVESFEHEHRPVDIVPLELQILAIKAERALVSDAVPFPLALLHDPFRFVRGNLNFLVLDGFLDRLVVPDHSKITIHSFALLDFVSVSFKLIVFKLGCLMIHLALEASELQVALLAFRFKLLLDLFLVASLFDLNGVALLLHLEVSFGFDHVSLALNLHDEELGDLLHLLSEVGLQILEERARADLDICDLNSLEPDAPALDQLEHFLADCLAHSSSVAQHLLDSRVGNAVANNGRRHRCQGVVRTGWVLRTNVRAKVLVGIEGAVADSVDCPNQHARNSDSLHLGSHLLRGELCLVDPGWELGDLVEWSLESRKADTSLLHLAVPHDEDPLVGFTAHVERRDKLLDLLHDLHECDEDRSVHDHVVEHQVPPIDLAPVDVLETEIEFEASPASSSAVSSSCTCRFCHLIF